MRSLNWTPHMCSSVANIWYAFGMKRWFIAYKKGKKRDTERKSICWNEQYVRWTKEPFGRAWVRITQSNRLKLILCNWYTTLRHYYMPSHSNASLKNCFGSSTSIDFIQGIAWNRVHFEKCKSRKIYSFWPCQPSTIRFDNRNVSGIKSAPLRHMWRVKLD